MGCGCNKKTTQTLTSKTYAVVEPEVNGATIATFGTEIEARAMKRRLEREGKAVRLETHTA